MSKEELLLKNFESVTDAMIALNQFLEELDEDLCNDETRGNYQNLKVIGTHIFE